MLKTLSSYLSQRALHLILTIGLVHCSVVLANNAFVGSQQCKSCHQQAYQKWQQSHHFKAMQAATAASVIGDFNNAVFTYNGLNHRFRQRNGEYFVITDNAKGQMQEYKIAYTFGFEPLQQYLIAMPDGRYQVLSICWDARPKSEGGQRWFHLYPEESGSPAPIGHEHPLHWSGYFQNWNSRCASCHSTDLQKNYDVKTNTFNTQFSEVNVACEACHGPGYNHIDWAQNTPRTDSDTQITSLRDRGEWRFKSSGPIAHRVDTQQPQQQNEACAACHSLRTPLNVDKKAAHDISESFDQQYSLRLLEDHYYQVDGQIDDEVFVYGSFLQSKMHQAGVVCSDCHDPHSAQVKGGAKNVCMQCHQQETYNQRSHHHHQNGSPGSFCVDCHMPANTYMGVDSRRDHRFSIPHPEQSDKLGTSNACNDCHQDKSHAWAAKARAIWPNQKYFKQGLAYNYSNAIDLSRKGAPEGLEQLLVVINNEEQSAIKRATALLELVRYPSQQAFSTSIIMLQAQNPMIRAAAIRSLAYLPPAQRQDYVSLSTDTSKTVRIEAAEFLAAIDTNTVPQALQNNLLALYDEYQQLQQLTADAPSAQIALANFYLSRAQPVEAKNAFKQALIVDAYSEPAWLSLAELSRQEGQSSQEKAYIERALTNNQDSAAANHAKGLWLVRQKNISGALRYLENAVSLAPTNARYSYVYAAALHSQGDKIKALVVVNKGLLTNPYEASLLQFKRQLDSNNY